MELTTERETSPIILRAARTLHLMEAMGSETDPDQFVARIEAAAEASTGFPREAVADEAEFIRITDEWFQLESDHGAPPEDPRSALLAVPIDPAHTLSGLDLLTGQAPQVLQGCVATTSAAPQLIAAAVINEWRMHDYAEILAGVLHLRATIWDFD